jgi:hypothetical protein
LKGGRKAALSICRRNGKMQWQDIVSRMPEWPMPSNDKAADILARFPGPVTLYPSRKKWLLVFLGGAAFTAGGIWMIRSGEAEGWYVTVFFALVAVIAIVVMLPGAGRLTLDRDGFEAKTLFRGHRTRWSDTRGFEASTIHPGNQHLVVYDDVTQKRGMLTGINVSITGHNAALGDTYGLSANDLAGLMAQWRERALAQSGRH